MPAIIQPRQLMSQPMGLAAIDNSVLPAGSIVWTPGNGGIMVGQITNIVTPAGMASLSNASSRIDFGRQPRLVAGAASWLFTITPLNSSSPKLSGMIDAGANYLEHIGVNQNESEESAQGYLMFGTRPTGASVVGNFSVPAALVVGQENTFCVVLESKSTVRVYRDGLEMTVVRSSGNPMNTAPGVTDYSLALLNRNARGAFSQGGNVACALFARIPAKVDGAKLSANPWQIFKPIPRRIFAPVSAGGGTTITTNLGTATASGLTATLTQAATLIATQGTATASGLSATLSQAFTLSSNLATATASGAQATIAQAATISAALGTATASGLTASVSSAGNVTVSCNLGTATASGNQANIGANVTVSASRGAASAAGYTAALEIAYTLAANLGTASATGKTATIYANESIACAVGIALASGYSATITNNAPITDSEKIDLILDILSNRQTLDPVSHTYTLYADDGVTVLKTALAFEDAAGLIPYRGQALQRLDPME